jgi:O-acetyl-ADP-ribose deacetylase
MVEKITSKNIDNILKLLPYFEDKNNQFYEIRKEVNTLIFPYIYSVEVMNFMDALRTENIIFPFDWVKWQDEAVRYFDNPELLKSADLLTLRKLLTLHVRKDRFCDGHFAYIIDSGYLLNILKRLEELRDN